MKLTFLGTGTSTGVPSIGCECETCTSDDPRDKRLRVSVIIEHAGRTVLVDTSADFRQQALRFGLKHLDAVLITHCHADHIFGLDDIRPLNFRFRSSQRFCKRTCVGGYQAHLQIHLRAFALRRRPAGSDSKHRYARRQLSVLDRTEDNAASR